MGFSPVSFVALLALAPALEAKVSANCTVRRESGFKCYEDLFGGTVNPIKGEFMSAALDDAEFGRAILRQWGAMVDAFDTCRKVDPVYDFHSPLQVYTDEYGSFDRCAGQTPRVPAVPEDKLDTFVQAKFDCMKSATQAPNVVAATEELKRDTEICFTDSIPSDLCMANDLVIRCFQREVLALLQERGASDDEGTREMINVFKQTRAFFEDPDNGPSLTHLCSRCYTMIGAECMPSTRPAIADEHREYEMYSCIAAFKSRKVAVFNDVFSECMREAGFEVDGHATAIIPEPRKWLALCMGLDAE